MKEVVLPDDEIIVSKTDVNSYITYGNRTFIQVSGYEEKELLGKPHNIIRHPDMPKAVFKLLWQTIKQQKEFFGLVKNRCKNGDYYWAFANITASFDNKGNVIGYYSIRRRPSKRQLDVIIPIYQTMLSIEQPSANDSAINRSSEHLLSQLANYGQDYDEALLNLYR